MKTLTPETITELQARRDALVRELAALDELLNDTQGGVIRATPQRRIRRTAALLNPASGHTGFRQRIREILAANPGGMRPIEVRAELERTGFVQTGKTKLSIRVPNELHRMMRNGELEQKDGKYSLVGS